MIPAGSPSLTQEFHVGRGTLTEPGHELRPGSVVAPELVADPDDDDPSAQRHFLLTA